MTLTQLNYIVAIAQHRNFGAAADACCVTQPTLSMQVQKLEEELGVVIFDRSQQPIKMTAVGEQIVQQARVVLSESQKIIELTNEEQSDVKGNIRIGVIPTLAPYIVPLFIQSFVTKYPEASVSIEELQTQQIVDHLKSDELDVGILVTPLRNSSIIEHPLFYEPFFLYTAPSHPLYSSKKVKENDLNPKDVWLLTDGHCFRDQVINLCGDRKGTNSKKGNLRFESGNLETLKKMVDQGNGYTLLPALAAREVSEPKRKQLKEFQQPVPTREVSLVHANLFKKRATIDALIEEIRSSVPTELLKLKQGQYHRVDLPKF